MMLCFFWIPIMELIWGICFIFVLIFNFIVDYWWAIILLIGLWCVIGYIANYGGIRLPILKLKRRKQTRKVKESKIRRTEVQETNKLIGSKWSAFINSIYILQFVAKDTAMFYKMDIDTFDYGNKPIFYLKCRTVDNTILFDGSVSIRGESYVFKNGTISGDTLKIEYRVTTDSYQWGEGVFKFGKVRDNGNVPIVYND